MPSFARLPAVLLALCLVQGFWCGVDATTVTTGERNALTDIWNATGNSTALSGSGWGSGDPCANAWAGVTCSAYTVTYVDVSVVA